MGTIEKPLVFLGGGVMARAIIAGGIGGGAIDPGLVVVSEPDVARHDEMLRLGVGVESDSARAMDLFREFEKSAKVMGQVVVAVKPQVLGELSKTIVSELVDTPRVVITILAGVPSHDVQARLGAHLRVVRVMPNIPAQVRRGMTAISLGAGAESSDSVVAERLFAAVGEVIRIDESMMDSFTAVAGSGPAYVFYLAEALASAARDVGFDEVDAERIVRATIAGAGLLMATTGESPHVLRARVTSKGGTTEAGIAELDGAGVQDAIARAVRAARDRGEDLAGLAGQ